MAPPLLATKLYLPAPRRETVLRRRLLKRLDDGLHRQLTLVSAPAGFGKTTLVSEWLAGCGQPVAWLSLDEDDNDPMRFLAYLVAALQAIAPGIAAIDGMGEAGFGGFQSTPSSINGLLSVLINHLTTVPDHLVLALDDYHVIHAEPIHALLDFLLKHLPPQLHILLSTREDPPLPLARLRAKGHLIELRATDLRFTVPETTEFLNQHMQLQLSAEAIAALDTRTEGWIVGLHLAALSMQAHGDVSGFIQAFTGSHRFVLDYLIEEVIRRQPADILDFLLQTAILDRLNASLCNAVTERNDGKTMLDALERGNLFLIPLDDQRQWYRYHHLFADVLRSQVCQERPDQVAQLHARASIWYEHNALPAEAIRHAFAAGDLDRAAHLIERAWVTMDVTMQSATWLRWASEVPDALIRLRPVLSVGYAWALLDSGDLEASEVWLHHAERWLETPSPERIIADEDQFLLLPATIATARAYRALALGILPDAITYTQQALSLTHDPIRRMQAMALLGLAQYANGDLNAADQALTEFRDSLHPLASMATFNGITLVLAAIKRARGRLDEAASTYEQALHRAASQGHPMPIGTADLYHGMSELACEQGNLDAAVDYLLTAQKLGDYAMLTGGPHRQCVAEARIRQAQGDLAGALTLLDEAERRYVRSPLPDTQPIAALRAQIWLAQGNRAMALAWVRKRGLSTDDAISYRDEFEHLTLARIQIAQYQNTAHDASLHTALRLLDRLLPAADACDRMESVIKIRILQALAHHAKHDIPCALEFLEPALTLAQPHGYLRIFVDEGQPMVALLQEAARRGITPTYVQHLQAAFAQTDSIIPADQGLIEPLSDRELDVLRMLSTDLSGPEIAHHLMVSLSTVRTHTQHIYTKLGVTNRRAAIRRAQELHLF